MQDGVKANGLMRAAVDNTDLVFGGFLGKDQRSVMGHVLGLKKILDSDSNSIPRLHWASA